MISTIQNPFKENFHKQIIKPLKRSDKIIFFPIIY